MFSLRIYSCRQQGLNAARETARLEARTGREELKRVRTETLRMRDELEAEVASHNELKVRNVHQTTAYEGHFYSIANHVHFYALHQEPRTPPVCRGLCRMPV